MYGATGPLREKETLVVIIALINMEMLRGTLCSSSVWQRERRGLRSGCAPSGRGRRVLEERGLAAGRLVVEQSGGRACTKLGDAIIDVAAGSVAWR